MRTAAAGPERPSALAPRAQLARPGKLHHGVGARARQAPQLAAGCSTSLICCLSLTSLFWAGNTILGRFIVGHVPPMTLAFIRWSGAFVILLPFAARHLARDWPVIRKHAGLMTLLALTGFSVYNTMAYYGLQYTTAINGLLLQSVGPLFVAMWTFALFGDRLTLRQAGGICVSLMRRRLSSSATAASQCCSRSISTTATSWFLVALLDLRLLRGVCCASGRPMHPLSFLAVGMGGGAFLLIPAVVLEIASGRTVIARRAKAF